MKINTENKILIFAIGQGGITSMNYLLTNIGPDKNTEFISLDSDMKTLKNTKTKHKIQIGRNLVRGCSCNSNSFLGRSCLYSNKRKFFNLLKGTKKIIILTTLGGGVSSGATSVLLELAKQFGTSTTVIFTIPQDFEGKIRKMKTKEIQKIIGVQIMGNKQVVIYARVSSREQEREGFSIPAQLKLLKEYALKNGFQIVQEYSDAETAKKAGRTNYNLMLAFLKANPNIRTILVEKADRLYRNFKDYVTIEDYDLKIHLVKEGSIISKNSKSHDKFIHGIKVLMAKNYIDNLSEEISKGLHEGLE